MTTVHHVGEVQQFIGGPPGVRRGLVTALTLGAVMSAPLLAASPAAACGGGFGADLEIEPDQTIVFTHDGTVESYLLQPTFCGPAADFGLIVPIPSDLLGDPVLGDDRLYAELDDLTEPTIEVKEVCHDSQLGSNGGLAGGAGGSGGGVDVISEGSVGIFDWVQLDAGSATAFTDWLDERAFPYEQEAMAAFDHYVSAGWKFVAFTVKAAEIEGAAMSPGGSLCGEFGPIELSFETPEPVVPARIAASDANSLYREFRWRVFAISAQKLQTKGIDVTRPVSEGAGDQGAAGGGSADGFLIATEAFAGELDAAALDRYPTLASLAGEGDWVTELQVDFEGMAVGDDFFFEPAPEQTPYREVDVRVEHVTCADGSSGSGSGGGLCAVASPSAGRRAGLGLFAAPLGWLLLSRARRRRARR